MTDVAERAAAPEIDEDLEDGEIESDEGEEEAKPPVVAAPPPPKPPVPEATTKPARAKEISPPKKKSKLAGDEPEDFATLLERQLAQALGKPTSPIQSGGTPDDKGKAGGGGGGREERHGGSNKNKKRRRRNDSGERERERDRERERSSRRAKKAKPDDGEKAKTTTTTTTAADQDEEMDDYEMMNVRGGSPPPTTTGAAAGPGAGSDGNESDRSYSSYDSYDSAEYHRRQRSRRNNRGGGERNRRGDRQQRRERDADKRRGGGGRAEGGGGGGGGGNSSRHHRDNNNGHDSDREQRDDYKNTPRKMELCKFYLMECCAKREKCLYMHQDFPCKYYYTGSECTQKDCKFAHGKPLTDALRAILMKHLETAPKEILGDFPRLGRELANQKIRSRHKELCMKFNVPDETQPLNGGDKSGGGGPGESANIPPLNDIYSKPPPPIRGSKGGSDMRDSDRRGGNNFDKNRKSRWTEKMGGEGGGGRNDLPISGANAVPLPNFPKNVPPPLLAGAATEKTKSLMSLKNLTNVLQADQIEKLAAIGIETLDQVKHLTVLQLTEIGLSISQLSEIQMNAMQMESMATGGGGGGGLLGSSKEEAPVVVAPLASIEVEEKNFSVPPPVAVPPITSLPPPVIADQLALVGDTDMRITPTVNQDVDMRFLGPPPPIGKAIASNERVVMREIASPDAAEDRLEPNAVADYSQYLKEANLVVEPKPEEKVEEVEVEKSVIVPPVVVVDEPKLLVHDYQGIPTGGGGGMNPETDDDDDDSDDDGDSKLKIEEAEEEEDDEQEEDADRDEAEDRKKKEEEREKEEEAVENPSIPSVSYWPLNLASLTSLNKIDLSASVAQMMSQEKNEQPKATPPPPSDSYLSMYNREENPVEQQEGNPALRDQNNRDSDSGESKRPADPRDPRNRDPRNSREPPKSPPLPRQPTVVHRPSMYDFSEGDESGGSSPAQKPDQDMRFFSEPSDFSNRDIDLRLPFKPMLQNYVPATEIDGSISSHMSTMIYKVVECDIPRPNFKDIRRRMSCDHTQDPRLKRIFALEDVLKEEEPRDPLERIAALNSDPRAAAVDPRMDPRRRKEVVAQQSPGGAPPAGLDIQIVLQKSSWYRDLGSKNKIYVNQQLAVLTSELKHYQEEVHASGAKPFDVAQVFEQSPMLQNVLHQLGVLVDDQGAIQPLGPNVGGMPNMMGGGLPEQNMAELAALISQQQQQGMNPAMFGNMNPNAGMMGGHPLQQQQQQHALMGQMGGIRPGLLGMAPPNMGFGRGPPFDDFGGGGGGGGPPPGDMANFHMMNYNDNMGGGGGGGQGGFFQQSQPNNNSRMNNNRGNFRGGRNDRWVHRGGHDGRRQGGGHRRD